MDVEVGPHYLEPGGAQAESAGPAFSFQLLPLFTEIKDLSLDMSVRR